MTDIENLFIKYCPIFYFHKKEPYMPADFDELLKIADLTPITVLNDDVKMMISYIINHMNNNYNNINK